MKIILDNGAYTLRNMDDVAMLQAAVERMRAMVCGDLVTPLGSAVKTVAVASGRGTRQKCSVTSLRG
jgi:hypothetical protein